MLSELKFLEKLAKDSILKAGRRLYQRNLLASCDGNISIRMSDDRILMTPTGVSKAELTEDQIAVITLEGEVLEGQPSSERLMHLEVYRSSKDAKAIVHAHPPYAIAWSVAHPTFTELPFKSLPEVILACGSIPIAPYARPGNAEMGEVLRAYLPRHRALIMARHGAICWGESLDEAVNGMERVDHSAQILFLASQMGPLTSLPEAELDVLMAMRKELGEKLL